METVVSYFTEHPVWGLIAAVLALVFIVGMIKSLFKMAMVIALIGITMVVFFDFKPQEIIDKGTNIADTGTEIFEDGVKPFQKLGEMFFMKEKDGETVDSLVEKYNLNDMLEQLSEDEQKHE